MAISPIPRLVPRIFRSIFQLLVRDFDLITAESWVVREDRPRQWVVVSPKLITAYANGICDLAADLVDHYAFNLSNVIAIQTIHGASDAAAPQFWWRLEA